MAAIAEAAGATVETVPDFRKRLGQLHRVSGQLGPVEAGGVSHKGNGIREAPTGLHRRPLAGERKQLHMAGGVASALQPP